MSENRRVSQLVGIVSMLMTVHPVAYAAVATDAGKGSSTTEWKEPFEILSVPKDAQPLLSRLGTNDSAVWEDGDVLTFLDRAVVGPVQLVGLIQQEMSRINGTDVWILQLKGPSWNRAFCSYGFVVGNKRGKLDLKYWRGKDAPQKAYAVERLQGQLLERTLHSEKLKEDRKVSVYLPPGGPYTGLSVVFMADGNNSSIEGYAQIVEPLIISKKIRPLAIIGLHNGGYRGDITKPFDISLDYRAREYLPMLTKSYPKLDDRFTKHMAFFIEEVLPWATKEFVLSPKRADRAVFGFSNGGAFAAAAAVEHPELFGFALPFSAAGLPADLKPVAKLPRFFLAAGELEPFSAIEKQLQAQLISWGADSSLDLYVAGHDPSMWSIALVSALTKAFPVKDCYLGGTLEKVECPRL